MPARLGPTLSSRSYDSTSAVDTPNSLRTGRAFFIIVEDSERSSHTMAVARKQKMFVLDTNVILHDSKCMYQFEEHDIVIPITVLEELDGFKKGNESLNFHAREFLRAVDGLAQQPLFGTGVQIGKDLGNIIVKVGGDYHEDLRAAFETRTPDHEI